MKTITNPFSFNPFNPIIWHWPLSGDALPIPYADWHMTSLQPQPGSPRSTKLIWQVTLPLRKPW